MPRLNFDIDEADLLKAYKVDTLTPKWVQRNQSTLQYLTHLNSKWQEVDHDIEDSVAGAVLSPTSGIDLESDPLGLGHTVKFSLYAIFC